MKDLEGILSQNFGLIVKGKLPSEDSEYLKYLQGLLAERIQFLINTDLDRLLQILYRIDVPQTQSDAAFAKGKIELVSSELAKNIITRQLKKIDYARKFYGSEN